MSEKKFGFFSQKERSDALAEDTSPTLAYFFKKLWRKMGKILTLNLMMTFRFLPLVAILLIYIFGQHVPTTNNTMYAPLLGISLTGTSGVAAPLLGIFGEQGTGANPSTAAWVVMIALGVFTVLTWGWQTVGGTYNLRSLVRGDSCFLWSDYFYAIRRNLKQGFFMGLLDVLAIAVLFFDWYYFGAMTGSSFAYGLMYFVILALAVIYIFMRFYIYLMMITFDLPLGKMLKNALIFSMLGIKRNIMALLGIMLLVGLNIALIGPSLSIGFTLPIILPFFYLPGFAGFMAVYAAYPNIRRYMIDGRTELEPFMALDDEDEAEAEEAEITPPAQQAD